MNQKEFDRMLEASNFNKQITAELIVAMRETFAIVIGAASRQMNAQAFADHLRAQMEAAKITGTATTGLTIGLATHVLAALDAESAFQVSKARH
jgi:hypothetical protein